MTTSNNEYQRLLFRHVTDLEGFEEELVASLMLLLQDTEQDLVARIRELLEEFDASGTGVTPARLRKLENVLLSIRSMRNDVWVQYNKKLRQELFNFAKEEVSFARAAFRTSVQLEGIDLLAPEIAKLRSALFQRPFRLNDNTARTLGQYMASIRVQDLDRLEQIIRIGFIEGLSVNQIVQSIRGTRQAGFRNGILQISRRHSEVIARTALNHFSNGAREMLWENNDDIMIGLVWTAVLDSSTTLICQSRDGHLALVGSNKKKHNLPLLVPQNARPPAHGLCRSIMVAMISPEGLIGTRPFVIDSRTGKRTDFSSARARQRWAARRIGRVPAQTNYEQFMRGEDFAFQKDVYGPNRAKLLRDGGLSIEDLVDRQGRRYTLQELRTRDAEAFRRAGLD